MIVSTRGRYALRVMIDLAEQNADSYVPLKDIARRQSVSQKYMEAIMSLLSKNGFVTGVHGRGGGYKLNRRPDEYKISEILSSTEETLAPVVCLEKGAEPCPQAPDCRTLPLWTELNRRIAGYLDSVTLADFMIQSSSRSAKNGR